MKVNKFELAPFQLISLGARGDVTVWLKPNRSFRGKIKTQIDARLKIIFLNLRQKIIGELKKQKFASKLVMDLRRRRKNRGFK